MFHETKTLLKPQHYYPFGLMMPGRSWSDGYRFGFNGQAQVDEINGAGNYYEFKYRGYDPRICQFRSVDPLGPYYPFWSPYAFAGNMPIWANDLEGLEPNFDRALEQQGAKLTTESEVFTRVLSARNANNAHHKAPTMDDLQVALDAVGLVPVFGEAADVLNGTFYLFRGQYDNATLSFAATIPVAGWAATSAKWSRNALKLSDNALHSSSGLVYKLGSKEGNRLSHLKAHSVDDLTRDYHGVFTVGDELISTVDEAWEIAKKGGDNVVKTVQKNGNVSYIVNMNKKVGYEGGQLGSKKDLTKINILVEEGTSNVVTAFPTK